MSLGRIPTLLARFVVERGAQAAALALVVIAGLSWLVGDRLHAEREGERLRQLGYNAERCSVELMEKTLNSSMMGALTMLGLIDQEIKLNARDGGKAGFVANSPHVNGLLETLGQAYAAEGVFVIASNGRVASSWDSSGRPSTGVDAKFRPYFQMAMQGQENVYAGVSLARGDRALYFAAPIYARNRRGGSPIGVATGRSDLNAIDQLLRSAADDALLLSPHGVVFASSRQEWIGYVSGVLSPEQLKSIRESRQFGKMFDHSRQAVLPFSVDAGLISFEGRRIAVATARVVWNDPAGNWKLVLIEDLSRTAPARSRWLAMAVTAVLLLLASGLLYSLLRGQYLRQQAARQLRAYAREQEMAAARKATLAAVGMRLQQARTAGALAEAFLSEVHQLLGALQGVVYAGVAGSDGSLQLMASFAGGGGLPATLMPGEGLLGQCAIERRLRVVTTAPPAFATIRSGLGEGVPAAVMIAPAMLNDELLGVVEIAMLAVPDAAACEQFEDLLRLLAMNLEIVGFTARERERVPAGGMPEHRP